MNYSKRKCRNCGDYFNVSWSNKYDAYCSGACEMGLESEAMERERLAREEEDAFLAESPPEGLLLPASGLREIDPFPVDDAEGRDA